MTGTRDKIRSLFLATLMVTSVFAGTIALSGTAAAATNAQFGASGATDAGVSGTIGSGANADQVVAEVTATETSSYDRIQVAVDNFGDAFSGVEDGDVDIYQGSSPVSGDTTVVQTSNGGSAITVETDAGDDPSPEEDEEISVQIDNVNLPADDEYSATVDIEPQSSGRTASGVLTVGEGADGIVTQQDNNPTERQNNQFDERLTSGDTYWQGQRLVIQKTDLENGQVDIRETESADEGGERIPAGSLVREVSLDSNGEAVINTENLEGTYAITVSQGNTGVVHFQDGQTEAESIDTDNDFGSDGEVENSDSEGINQLVQAASFSVTAQNVNVGFQSDESAQEEIYLEADSARTGYNMTVEADGLDDGEVEEIFDDEFEDNDNNDNAVEAIYDISTETDYSGDGVLLENVNSDANITANFSEVDIGDYEFSFEVTDTGVSDSSSVSVTEEDDVNAEILRGGVATAAQGDFAVIPIQLEETDEAKVNVGFNDVNFNASFRIEDGNDDGVVTVNFNTFVAGRNDNLPSYLDAAIVEGSSEISDTNALNYDPTQDDGESADQVGMLGTNQMANTTLSAAISADDNEDTVTLEGSSDFEADELGMVAGSDDDLTQPTADVGIDGPMEPDQYDVNVTSDGDELDVGTVQVVEPQATGITSWTMPGDTFSDVEEDETAELYEFVNAGELTETNNVAEEDVLVYQVQSTSMFGSLKFVEDAYSNWDFAQSLDNITTYADEADGDNFKFTVEQTEDSTVANQDEKELVLDESADNGMKVVPDERNSSLFVVLNEDNLELTRGDAETDDPNHGMEDGESYVANWTTFDDADIGDEAQTVTDRASITEKSIDFDTDAGDIIRVAASPGQVIEGSTSVAPGTELNIRLRSTGDSPFLEDPEAIVSENRTFSTTVDLSDRANNATFSANAQGFDEDYDTPGVIGDAMTADVTFDDQTVEDGTVSVEASLSDGGFVSIRSGSASGEVLGASDYTESGEVSIDVGDVSNETTLYAVAHMDTNNNEALDFEAGGDVDTPYTLNGSVVSDSATVSPAEDTEPADPGTETEQQTDQQTDQQTEQQTDAQTDEQTEQPTTTEGGPGFTAVLALVALVAAALLAVRRRD